MYQLAFALTLVLIPRSASAITFIDTFPAVDTTISSLGEGDGAQTYGQTFTVPLADPVLARFTVSTRTRMIGCCPLYPGTTTFEFGIMEWDDFSTRAVGPVLYLSSPVAVPASQQNFIEYSFTPDLSLSPGGQYVAAFSTSNHFDGITDAIQFEFANHSDPYGGGGFFFLVNGNDFSQVSTQSWDSFFNPHDLGFRAEFVPVPEPSTGALIALGISAIVVLGRRSSNRKT